MSTHCQDCYPLTFIKYAGECSDPCDPCGTKTPTSCVQYGGETLSCINVPAGTTLDVILKNINDIICQLQACCSTTTTSTSSTSSTTTTSTSSTSTTTTTTTQCPCSTYQFTGIKGIGSAQFTFLECGYIEPITIDPGDNIVYYCVDDSQPIIQIGIGNYEKIECCSSTTTTTTLCPCTNFEFSLPAPDPEGNPSGFIFVECGALEVTNLVVEDPTPVIYCVDKTYQIISYGSGLAVDTFQCCSPTPTTTTTTTTEAPICVSYGLAPDGFPSSWQATSCDGNPVGGVILGGVDTGCIWSNTLVLNNATITGQDVCVS